ncbi:MAG: hypothetical protein WHV66_06955 [Anaerolineales bacterium]
MFRRSGWRLILGGVLLVLGSIGLLQALNVLPAHGGFYAVLFGTLFAVAGLAFLSILFGDRSKWWAAIPGIILVGLSGMLWMGYLAPGLSARYGGAFFLACIGLSFVVVYFLDRSNWWAIIPAGVMFTLVAITALENISGLESGGLIFFGLALTFALLGIVPVEGGRMRWPWYPALILLVMGIIISFSIGSILNYVWPLILILIGLMMVFRTLRS